MSMEVEGTCPAGEDQGLRKRKHAGEFASANKRRLDMFWGFGRDDFGKGTGNLVPVSSHVLMEEPRTVILNKCLRDIQRLQELNLPRQALRKRYNLPQSLFPTTNNQGIDALVQGPFLVCAKPASVP